MADTSFLRSAAPLLSVRALEPTPSIATAPRGAARPRVLMLCALISMPYRVMRVARDAGADVYVLGSAMSSGLHHSRFCRDFVQTNTPITGERNPGIAAEINRWASWFGIDMVLPGDVQATRTLIATRDLIDVPLFPMPTLRQFDDLNNKWFFTERCAELGILAPNSQYVRDTAELREELAAGRISLPAIVKPVNHDGGLGVIRLDPDNASAQTMKIDYAPIIVQEFIPGRDIGASVYCERGEIKAFIAHELKRATYRSLDDLTIFATLSRIMAYMNANGVFNFDMRLTPDGKIYYLECNPRFFFKINLSMLAGVNFVRMGLSASRPNWVAAKPQTAVRMPKALAATALTAPWKITTRDLKMLWYLWRDPISSLRETLGIDWEYPEEITPYRHFVTPAQDGKKRIAA